MKQPTDNDIENWIEKKKFSSLSFLDSCWSSSDNPKYLGFYYFSQLNKGENIGEVWRQVLQKHKSESDAYFYLGEVAKGIYKLVDQSHICADFFRMSIEYNKNNSQSLWRLYKVSRVKNVHLLLRSIKLDFELGNADKINHKLFNTHINQNFGSDFSNEDWHEFKEILLNTDNNDDFAYLNKAEFLILTYYHLGESQLGLELIGNLEEQHVSYEVLKPYLEAGLISKLEVADNVYEFQSEKALAGDCDAIFVREKAKFEEELGKEERSSFIKSCLITSGFRARAYSQVIELFENKETDDHSLHFYKQNNLHYLISLLLEGRELNKSIYKKTILGSDGFSDKEKILFKLFNAYSRINKIKQDINNGKVSSHSENNNNFKTLSDIIKDEDVIKHWMYDSLKKDLSELSKQWNEENDKKGFKELEQMINSGEYNRSDLNKYLFMLIENEEFQQAIDELVKLKEKMPLNMLELNQLGVCYERMNDVPSAYEYYKLAVDVMVKSKENNNTIISNFISLIDKLKDKELSSEEYESLKELYNIALCRHFYHHTFIFKNRASSFKYQPFNINTIDSLTSKYFYLANKEQLNDPVEMPVLDHVGGESLMCSDYRILSLTNNNNSMLMWSHYADQHQGIMVEYWFGGELPDGVGISKVSYDHAQLRKDNQYIFNQYLLTKNNDWEYEDEVRVFSHKKKKVYYEDYCYPGINSNKINARVVSITLGLKFPKDKIQLIQSIIQGINRNRSEHIPPITLNQAVLDPDNQFELIFQPIDLN